MCPPSSTPHYSKITGHRNHLHLHADNAVTCSWRFYLAIRHASSVHRLNRTAEAAFARAVDGRRYIWIFIHSEYDVSYIHAQNFGTDFGGYGLNQLLPLLHLTIFVQA
jgi:hypothetical protein